MGRHSLPGPGDSAHEPSDESFADDPYRGDAIDPRPSGGHRAGDGYQRGPAHSGDFPSGNAGWFDEQRDWDEHRKWDDSSNEWDDSHHSDEDEPYAYGEPDYPAEDRYSTGDEMAPAVADEYPDFPTRRPGAAAVQPSSPPPPLLTAGGHRGVGEWRGGHRSAEGRRGVSIGVIIALVAVVAVVGVVIMWNFFGDALSHRGHNAAARCVGGKETIAVITDPTIADNVRELAENFNSSAGPVGDHCISVSVKPADSDAVLNGFTGKWPAELGGRPALWIPGSSISAARLSGAVGQQAISDSRSLVTSPVVLAMRPELEHAFGNQNWAALPGLQSNPNALAGLNLPAWGSLRLALPIGGNGDAAQLAGEAVAAASVPAGAPATQGLGAVRTLVGGQPKLADNSLAEAMNTLLNPGDAATAKVHAVITTEQQLFQRGQSLADAKNILDSWLPPGPAAVADYPTVLLKGPWVSEEQTTAASEFSRFMHKPEQLARLAKAGFRVNGVKPPSSAVTSFPALGSTLSVGDDGMRATLANSMTAPSSGVAATIMLDQSLPADDGGKTRLANVVAALTDRIKALPPTSVMGLWTFDGHEGRSEVSTGPLADSLDGQPRSATLLAALDKQYSSNGGEVSFTTLRMIYDEMKANYRVGQKNSILVITAGPHTDQSLDGAGLQDAIRQSADQAKPIAINIIDFGGDPDRATWEAVARLSGGGYRNLTTSASPDLAAAINSFLS